MSSIKTLKEYHSENTFRYLKINFRFLMIALLKDFIATLSKFNKLNRCNTAGLSQTLMGAVTVFNDVAVAAKYLDEVLLIK